MRQKNMQQGSQSGRRIVTPSGGNLRGKFPSFRYGGMISWEGDSEEYLLFLIEFSTKVKAVKGQPETDVRIPYDSTNRKYTPDYLLRTEDGDIYVQCKPQHRLDEPKIRDFMRAVKMTYERHGMDHRCVSRERMSEGHALDNARQLLPHRIRPMQPECEFELRAMEISLRPVRTFEEAMEIAGSEEFLLTLLAAGLLFFDFRISLSMRPEIHAEPLSWECDSAAILYQ